MLAAQAGACLLAVAVLASASGCGRGRAIAEEGERVEHDRGFALTVPDGWSVFVYDEGARLVRDETHGHGYPTLRIEAVGASDLPRGFPVGRNFRWTGGRAGFDYARWSSGVGYGSELTVHLEGDGLYLVATAQLWERKVRTDRAFYRQEIWPILNSVEQL